jgi:hypothetical protein
LIFSNLLQDESQQVEVVPAMVEVHSIVREAASPPTARRLSPQGSRAVTFEPTPEVNTQKVVENPIESPGISTSKSSESLNRDPQGNLSTAPRKASLSSAAPSIKAVEPEVRQYLILYSNMRSRVNL